jgi:hypothetical protein
MEKKQNGGARPGAGRKPKATELELIERLSPMDDLALETLKTRLREGDMQAIKLFFEYRYGKPKQDVNLSGNVHLSDEPIIFE